MYLRAVGRRFTQMNAYFLVMNSKRCKTSKISFHLILFSFRAVVCKYREFSVKTKISKSSYSVRKNPWVKHFRKSQSEFPKNFLFRENRQKWNAAPRHIVAGLKPLNYTIFKALGKKGGSRKQVHLWQVNNASQLQYYFVKILQGDAFFTRLRIARRFPSSALS